MEKPLAWATGLNLSKQTPTKKKRGKIWRGNIKRMIDRIPGRIKTNKDAS